MQEVKGNLKYFCFSETKSFVSNFDNIVKFVRNIIFSLKFSLIKGV